jgi:uncharacterized membrane protein YtjA (UPF0391 family)
MQAGARQVIKTSVGRWKEKPIMIRWAALFLVIALVAGLLGFAGIAGAASNIAWIIFVLFLILFVVSLFMGGRTPAA